MTFPEVVPNWIAGTECLAVSGKTISKLNPADGMLLFAVTRSGRGDVEKAVRAAKDAHVAWSRTPAVERGLILHEIVKRMEAQKEMIAYTVHRETGKSMNDAMGEVGAAIQLGLFYASEGQRFYGKTCTTGIANRLSMTIRDSVGVAGLIVAANTPIANVAWKVFPALICGNGVVLKGAEDTPATAWLFGKIAHDAGLPEGVLNIIQGYGQEAGQPLVEHRDVGVVSFTGSSMVGKLLGKIAGARLAKTSLELGGKNAFVVCDDANLEKAVHWAVLSAFSNAGQRCVAGSRIIVFQSVYEEFREKLLAKTSSLKLGPENGDDFGPVVNERQLANMIAAVDAAVNGGATLLAGGGRLKDEKHKNGFYMAPTILEGVASGAPLSREEVFGPICCLYEVADYAEAVALTNDCDYGLSACIHTGNFHRGIEFCKSVETGMAVVNGGTFGSEPHMPFGGTKDSGNGSREPGTEAIDIYSNLKDIYLHTEQEGLK